jgi:hypothetical protein
MERNPDPDPGSGMNIPDYFSKSLETVFRVKNTLIFHAGPDPGSGIFLALDPRCSDPGFGKNIPDPQHSADFFKCLIFNTFKWHA